MKNPMNDKEFLYQLSQFRQKETYAKIIALNFNEQPLEQIEGKVTAGSLNIDGSSAVRRTCNLTMVAKDVNISDFYWGVSNKFTLEIGIKNQINSDYPEIIWFP
jgi:flagellar hook assembly protein FlgD